MTWRYLISRFMENVNKQWRNFLALNLDMVPWNSSSGGFTYIWQSKWVGVIAIKTERKLYFFSDILVAVASLDLKVPNYYPCPVLSFFKPFLFPLLYFFCKKFQTQQRNWKWYGAFYTMSCQKRTLLYSNFWWSFLMRYGQGSIKDLSFGGEVPDHFTFLGNCTPTPPLSQHFTLREK